MHIYLIGYFLLFVGSILWFRTYPKIKAVYCIALLYIFALIIFRGDVGTDTGTYESIIDVINWDTWNNQATEVGFNFSVALLNVSNFSSPIILRILTAIYAFLLVLIIFFSKNNIKQVIIIYFIPVTIYIFSMNALRIGIASNLFILSLLLYNKSKLMFYVCLILSLSFHITTFILIPLVIIFSNINYKLILGAVLSFILSIGVFFIFQEHINNKITLYTSYASPSVYSGISDILVFIVLIYFYSTYPVSKKYKLVFTSIMSILVLLSFAIAKFSYAGLRLLQLLLIFSPFIFIYLSNMKYKAIKMPSHSFWILFFSTLITVFFTLRNFLDSEGSPYAFIPYTFIFN